MPLDNLLLIAETNPWLAYAVIALFSLLIGSFFNVVIHRLPIMMERDWKTQCADLLKCESGIDDAPYNLIAPRSGCPSCGYQIKWYENIPVISYLFLRGKCRKCKTGISIQYPLIELSTAVLAIVCLQTFGINEKGLLAILFTWLLLILAVIDLKTTYLPDILNYLLLWSGLIISIFVLFINAEASIIGAAAGYLSLWSVYWVFKIITKKEGMGHGDFKLLAAICAWTGIAMLPAIIVISSVVGSIIGIGMILFKQHKHQSPIPFGPYLAIAGWICFMWKDEVQQSFLGVGF